MSYKKWITVVCFSMVVMGMSACGKSGSDDTGTEVMGRVTAVSDSDLTLAVFQMPEGEKPEGGMPDGKKTEDGKPDGDRPDGEKPNGEKPDGNRPESVSGGAFRQGEEPPEGTPPAGQQGEERPDRDAGPSAEQTQKILISSDTKVYRQQGEEKTEATISDVEPGSMVTVVVDGEEAVSITIQTMNGRGGGRGKQNQDL